MLFVFGLVSALALGVPQPPLRHAALSQKAASIPAANDTDALFKAYDSAMFGKRFDEALAIARKLQLEGSEGQAFTAAMQASAMLGLNRDAEARALIAKAEHLAPSSPDASRVLFFGALITDRPEFAADALDRMIARAPDMVRELNWQNLRYFLTHEPKDQQQRNDDRRVALARLGYGADAEQGGWLAAGAVDILVRRGDAAGAADLLQYIDAPQAIENMLIQKRYSALWPQLQQLAGPHLEKVRASSAAKAERAFADAPNDNERLAGLANALRHAGRLDDAIALRAKLPGTAAEMSTADENMGWAINNVALALYHAGREDEADRILGMLDEAPMTSGRWRVSMIINRLEMLTEAGKFDRAAALLDVTETSAKVDGSDYARQLVRRLKYCILSSSGRKDEAAKLFPDMMAHAEDALEPTISGLVCGGEIDQAEQLALKGLGNSDEKKRLRFEEDFVRSFQPVALTSDDPSVWDGGWQILRKRPAMAAAYARLGRDMPTDLVPPKSTDAAGR
jgi:tetratricopeptide (TPR) repeat protein